MRRSLFPCPSVHRNTLFESGRIRWCQEWGEGAGDKDEMGTNSPEVANDTEASLHHRVGEPRVGSRGCRRVRGICCQRGEAVDVG